MSDAEVLVIGGGPAGAAVALGLVRRGRRVVVIERDATAREKVCGEFLGPGATAVMTRLGLAPETLGGVKLERARLAHGGKTAGIELPFAGWGLARRSMDAALLDAAQAAGAGVVRGQAVVAATQQGDEWTLRLAGGQRVTAPVLVLATGKHELRGHGRAAPCRAVGLKLHLRLAADLDETVLFADHQGYAGLQPTSGGLANLCMALTHTHASPGEPPRDAAGLIARVAQGSDLGARLLAGAAPLWPRPLAVAGVPYGYLHRDAAAAPPGLYRVGDQFAVVPSFCGEGMAMALAGGLRAADSIASGQSAAAFHTHWRRDLATPMRWAALANWLFDAAPGLLVRAACVPGAGRLVAARTRSTV